MNKIKEGRERVKKKEGKKGRQGRKRKEGRSKERKKGRKEGRDRERDEEEKCTRSLNRGKTNPGYLIGSFRNKIKPHMHFVGLSLVIHDYKLIRNILYQKMFITA